MKQLESMKTIFANVFTDEIIVHLDKLGDSNMGDKWESGFIAGLSHAKDNLINPVIDSFAPAGHWTTQPPTEPGWYWFAPMEGPVDVVEVFKARNGNELLATDNMATYALKEMDGTWFSEPLTVPGKNKE